MLIPRNSLNPNHISTYHLRLHRSEQQRRAHHQHGRPSLLGLPNSIIGTGLFHPQESVVRQQNSRSLSEPIRHRDMEEEKCNSFLHSMKTNHSSLVPPTATVVIHPSTPIRSKNEQKKFSSLANPRRWKSLRQRPMTAQSIPSTSTQRIDLDFDLTIKSFGQTMKTNTLLDDKE